MQICLFKIFQHIVYWRFRNSANKPLIWPRAITNNRLWPSTQQPICFEIRRRKWGCIDHKLGKLFVLSWMLFSQEFELLGEIKQIKTSCDFIAKNTRKPSIEILPALRWKLNCRFIVSLHTFLMTTHRQPKKKSPKH